tara:strand:- start:111 stop:422 length:312 start_codon:yes stop_codon:yes gene_type:complete
MYYDTTKSDERLTYENKALRQDMRIELFFKQRPEASVGASEVWQAVFNRLEHVPITSVRRSLNTLAAQGVVVKTSEKIDGAYGRPEYGWRLAPPAKKQTNLFN